MNKYDVLWYMPRHKARVLELLKIPTAAERARRGVFGLRWGPGQPPPPGQKGRLGDYALVFGNFLGLEIDPDLLRKTCELTEIEPGLVGGTIRKEFFESERYQERLAEQERIEQETKRAFEEGARDAALERAQAEMECVDGLLLAIADRLNVRKPEKLSRERLLNLYNLALVSDEFDVPSVEEWKTKMLGDAAGPAAAQAITLENCGDWEAYMGQAWTASSAPTLTVVKKAA